MYKGSTPISKSFIFNFHFTDKHVENTEILTMATVYKKEDRRSFVRTGRKDITSEELWTSLMADVMEHQNSEAQRVLKLLIKKVLNLFT